MARRKSLVSMIRELVETEVGNAIQSLLGTAKAKAKNGRRRRKPYGKWRPGGPGRPPRSIVEARKSKAQSKVKPRAAKTGSVGRRRRRSGRIRVPKKKGS